MGAEAMTKPECQGASSLVSLAVLFSSRDPSVRPLLPV